MELKEAIKQLESLKEDRKSFLENDAEHDEIFLKDIEAIETVLQTLEELQKENHRLKNWKQYKEIREMRRTDEAIEKARKCFAEKELLKGE